MKPSSDTAMTHMHQHKFFAPAAVLLCTLMLGACSSLGSKPTPPPPTAKGSPTTLPGKATSPAAKPAPKPIDKGDPDARFKAALDLLKQGQAQDAEVALTDLVKDFPQYSGPLTDLGLIYAKSKRFDLAASAFSKAIANNSKNAIAYNWQGMLFREANNFGGAEKAYKNALDINPDYGYAHLNLGILYDVYLKRPKDALAEYKEYQRLGGADDLRVLVWVADLEKALAPAAPPPPTPLTLTTPSPAAPAAAKPTEKKP